MLKRYTGYFLLSLALSTTLSFQVFSAQSIQYQQPKPIVLKAAPDTCGIEFSSEIRPDQRGAICSLVNRTPDFHGAVTAVSYNPDLLINMAGNPSWANMAGNQWDHLELRSPAMDDNLYGQNEQFYLAHEISHRIRMIFFPTEAQFKASEVYRAMQAEKAGIREYSYVNTDEQFADLYAASVVGNPKLDQYPMTKAAIERLRENVQTVASAGRNR